MRNLVAVVTCQARTFQADAIRRTWARGADDTLFFVGGELPYRRDQVLLPVDDSYAGLPEKVRALMGWALSNGYDSVLKVDDDVYLSLDRARVALPTWGQYDYAGNFRMQNGRYPACYASGFAYWLGRRAMEIVAGAELTDDTMEDRWVGNTLAQQRPLIRTCDEKRFGCTYPAGIDEARFLWGSPIGKSNIAYAQYPFDKFDDLHYWYGRTFTGAQVTHA